MKLILILLISLILPTIAIADLNLDLPENITTIIIIEPQKKTPEEIIKTVGISSAIIVIAIGIIAVIFHVSLEELKELKDIDIGFDINLSDINKLINWME